MTTPLSFSRRPDIQGLRALAVILVIGSHLPTWGKFAGGFVGVDIFFVISGYVITRLLLARHQSPGEGFFREYVKFMWSRGQRLVPALFVMILAVTGLAFVLGPPLEFRATGRAALWSELFVSNFFFLRSFDSYWNPELLRNPFLHTWSLGVEFQIYLVLPLALFSLIAFGLQRAGVLRRALVWVSLLSALSLAMFLFLVSSDLMFGGVSSEGAAFYLPVTRFWEFGAGALAILILSGSKSSWASHKLGSYVGWVLIVLGTIGSHIVATISWFILSIVVGTALVLAAGEKNTSLGFHRVLSSKPLVWLGDRSYSLYLWHWPLLIVAVWLVPDSVLGAALAIILSVLFADLSYRFLERRKSRTLSGSSFAKPFLWNSVARLAGASLLVVLITLGLTRVGQMNWYVRANVPTYSLPESQISAEEVLSAMQGCDISDQEIHCDYFGSDTPQIVIIGDSLSWRAFPAVAYAARELGYNASELWQGGCSIEENSCPEFIYEYLGQHEIAALLVATNFDRESSLVNAAENAAGEKPECVGVSTRDCPLHLAEIAEFEKSSLAGIKQLQQYTPNIFVASTFPQQSPESWTGLYPPLIFRIGEPPVGRGTTSLEWQRERQGLYPEAIAKVISQYPGTELWEPYEFLCNSDSCPGVIDEGEQIMDDPIHWSWQASRFLYSPIVGYVRNLGNRN